MRSRPLACTATLLLTAAALAQQPAQLVQDLGDPVRSAAAERQLVQRGAETVPLLAELLVDPAASGLLVRERLLAVLRVIDQLGAAAVALQPGLEELSLHAQVPAVPELLWVRGSLQPYVDDQEWTFGVDVDAAASPDGKARLLTGLARHRARQGVDLDATDAELLELLRADPIFAREVAAELLGSRGCKAAFVVLRQRLLDRSIEPLGFDTLKHNGFVVPMQDGFRQRAAEAMLQLDADNPASAVAWGCRALLHPFRSVRHEALQHLRGGGLLLADAVPELLRLAQGDDVGLAIEALEVLGMSATRAAECLAVAERLAQAPFGELAQRARALAAQLRAMHVELPPASKSPDFAARVAELGDAASGEAATAALRRAGVAAVPALQQRLRTVGGDAPEALLRLLVELGRRLDDAGRAALRMQLLQRHDDSWDAPVSGTIDSSGDLPELEREWYAELVIGEPVDAMALAGFLQHDSAYVRRQAARRLATAPPPVMPAALVAQLLAAVREEPPDTATFQRSDHLATTVLCDLAAPIQAAAAAALRGAEVDAAATPQLLAAVQAYDDGAVVVTAIGRWSSVAAVPTLSRALADARPAVAIAAAHALARLGVAAAAALPALRQAMDRTDAGVAAAATSALRAVQGH